MEKISHMRQLLKSATPKRRHSTKTFIKASNEDGKTIVIIHAPTLGLSTSRQQKKIYTNAAKVRSKQGGKKSRHIVSSHLW
jgi:hypothetical protein